MGTTIDNQNAEQPKSKGNIVLRTLSKFQKEKLLTTEVGLAGVAVGASAFAIMGFISKNNNTITAPRIQMPLPHPEEQSNEAIVICTEAPFAKSVTDEMDFEKAYETARNEVGPGGFFEHEGKLYNTYTQEEWNSMTTEQQENYWISIDQNTTQTLQVDATVVIPMNEPIDAPGEGVEITEVDSETVTTEIIDDEDHQFEEKIIKELDSNNDGKSDIFMMDANGNEIHDLVLDTNFDGNADIILMDVNVDGNELHFEGAYTMTGEVLDIGNSIELGQGVFETHDNINGDDTNADDLNADDLHGLSDDADPNFDDNAFIDDFNV